MALTTYEVKSTWDRVSSYRSSESARLTEIAEFLPFLADLSDLLKRVQSLVVDVIHQMTTLHSYEPEMHCAEFIAVASRSHFEVSTAMLEGLCIFLRLN